MDALILEWKARMEALKMVIADSNAAASAYAKRLQFDKALMCQNMGRKHMEEYLAIRRCRNELIQLRDKDNE